MNTSFTNTFKAISLLLTLAFAMACGGGGGGGSSASTPERTDEVVPESSSSFANAGIEKIQTELINFDSEIDDMTVNFSFKSATDGGDPFNADHRLFEIGFYSSAADDVNDHLDTHPLFRGTVSGFETDVSVDFSANISTMMIGDNVFTTGTISDFADIYGIESQNGKYSLVGRVLDAKINGTTESSLYYAIISYVVDTTNNTVEQFVHLDTPMRAAPVLDWGDGATLKNGQALLHQENYTGSLTNVSFYSNAIFDGVVSELEHSIYQNILVTPAAEGAENPAYFTARNYLNGVEIVTALHQVAFVRD